MKKKVREKSRECHNYKPQPFPDPKMKRKPTNPKKHISNKRTKSTKPVSRKNQVDIIEAFNKSLRYLDDLLNIDYFYFDQMVDRIYPTELQLNRANSSDTKAPFLDWNLCISNGTVSTKIYDKRNDFDFDIVSFR